MFKVGDHIVMTKAATGYYSVTHEGSRGIIRGLYSANETSYAVVEFTCIVNKAGQYSVPVTFDVSLKYIAPFDSTIFMKNKIKRIESKHLKQ